MRRSAQRIRGLGFIIWHARHEFYHILLGLVWAWFLREWWHHFSTGLIWWSLFASLLPDLDHFFYFFLYGRKDRYAKETRMLLKSRQWGNLVSFWNTGHKSNTSLATHNVYFVFLLFTLAALSSFIAWQLGVVLFGAMVIHYLFDIVDDILLLGKPNPNWKHLRRMKSS